MLMNRFQARLLCAVEPFIVSMINNGFKTLVEEKHLYQNLQIDLPEYEVLTKEANDVLSNISGDRSLIEQTGRLVLSSIPDMEWKINNPGGRRSLPGYVTPTESEDVYVAITIEPQTLKLYCGVCKRIEAYNFEYGSDLIEDFRGPKMFTDPTNQQVFSLAYQCQSCKSTPEIIIVKRDKLKISQNGRSPMETFEVPNFLPSKQKKYHSDAIIAFNSGQILAGNFLLRTEIEQFVRSISDKPNSTNIDLLFSNYQEKLPGDFKQRFPSLKSIYDSLSKDLHGAIASSEVFLQSKDDIQKHFRAKELYEI